MPLRIPPLLAGEEAGDVSVVVIADWENEEAADEEREEVAIANVGMDTDTPL